MANVDCAIVVSDLHCGCRLGLCPPRVKLDGGGTYQHSAVQKTVWQWWKNEFWGKWVPSITDGKPFVVVLNGDILEGCHHRATSQISQNKADQAKIAQACLLPVLEKANPAAIYFVRGTEAHAGESSEDEERLSQALNIKKDKHGNYTRPELWLKVGDGLAHFQHHISTSGSNAYESTALCKEFSESCTEAARWGYQAPDWVVRSHRHRHAEVRVPTRNGRGQCITLPAWQLKTPFCFKIAGARLSSPQIGGCAILARHGEFFTRSWVQNVEREAPEIVEA